MAMQAFLFITQFTYQNYAIAMTKTFTFSLLMAFIISLTFSQCYRKSKLSVPRHAALPPGPTPWPFVGCLPEMWTNNTLPHQWIHAIMKQYDTEIACIRLGNTYVIPVTSPQLALEFLKTHDSVFASRPMLDTTKIITRGFLTTALSPLGEQWKKMRKILTSQILNPSTLHQMLAHRTHEADTLLRYIFSLTKSKGAAVVNLRSVTLHYCGNVIRRVLFNRRYYGAGQEDGGPTFEEEEHIQALLALLKYINAFSVSDFIPCLRPFDVDKHQKIVKEGLKVVRKHDEPIVDERVQQWKYGKRKEIEDFLDIFIALKYENGKSLLSIEEIKAEITELQMATIDNPSNAVEWAMAELLNQPKILQKAIEELDRIVERDRLVQEYDIPQLKYLIACVRFIAVLEKESHNLSILLLVLDLLLVLENLSDSIHLHHSMFLMSQIPMSL
ncbi:phenylalanine N-monooxygenase-like [Momordica charantia]|uniref:Phenylalanine N-monooxygenase-like n=1 Tax=Momordica charantia TaxID=3673 RepID=A0A6J1DLV4_MOMCH|nr:phenylalanine N-monooxygenase-like [Momordica charantia]